MTRRGLPAVPGFVVAIALANFLQPVNSTMLFVALPLIARDFTIDLATSTWLVTAYLIAQASLQPIGGRVGDRLGRRRLMLGALAFFVVASVGAAFAPTFALLVVFRLLQATAAAAFVPNGLALLRGEAVGGRAGTYFGISSAMAGAGAAVGPLLGGLLSTIDWRLIFLANLPLAGTAILLAWRAIPEGDRPRPTARPDVVGAISLGALLALAAWTLTQAGILSEPVIAVLALAVVGGAVVFVRYEDRHPDPALPPRFFTIRAFSAANATIAFANLSLYGTQIAVPLVLAAATGASSVRSGVVLSAMAATQIVFAPVAGYLVDRVGARWPTGIGGLLIAAGLAAPVVLGRATDDLTLALSLPIAGAGLALTFPSTRIAAMDAVPDRHAGLASGVTSSSRFFGGMVGSLLAGTALASSAADPSVLFLALAGAGVCAAASGITLPARIHAPREPEILTPG